MPDSPDSVSKSQINVGNIVQDTSSLSMPNLNGTHSPKIGRSPSPSETHQVLRNSTEPTLSHENSCESSGLNGIKGRHPVTKVKKVLIALQQAANGISSEASERVHSLILGLVSNTLSIEEFQSKIQAVTNYPLKPFAIPLLKCYLPLLQAELLQFSKTSKLNQSEQYSWLLTESYGPAMASTANHNRHASQKPSFLESNFLDAISNNQDANFNNHKRRSPVLPTQSINTRDVEQNYGEINNEYGPPSAKKPYRPILNNSPRLNRIAESPNLVSSTAPSYNFRSDNESSTLHYPFLTRDRFDRFDRFEREFCRPFYGNFAREFPDDRDNEEEWRNIHTMLNCILGMVEKTKRALSILQQRSLSEKTELPWSRFRCLDTELDIKKLTGRAPPPDVVTHFKIAAEDRVSEVRRRAEDAVNEVKRQAVMELQKAVSVAETKANELVASERLKMERLMTEAKKQALDEAHAQAQQQQQDSTENCWNCGRKGSETCSGCSVARYCGSFCQHKDWEHHHKICGGRCSSTSPPAAIAASNSEKHTSTTSADRICPLDLKHIKTDNDSDP